MESHVSLEEVLHHVNKSLPPEDRVPEEEIARVGAELKQMLSTAAAQDPAGPAPSGRSLRTRLAALWAALKEKLAALLAPLSPRWNRLIGLIREKLAQVDSKGGMDALLGMVLVVVVVAVLAALIKSLPLFVALLALTGLLTFVRLLAYATRLPLALCGV